VTEDVEQHPRFAGCCELATRNVSDFSTTAGLPIINPFD
jgi:hypothetical protein